MRYKRSTYIAINVNIQNINIFSIWYLYYAINSHSHRSGREKRVERDAVENEWKRANSLWICSLCWLIDCLLFFLALLPRQIGYMPILSPDFNTHHGHTRTMIIEPGFLPFRVIAKEKIICSELSLFDLCIFIFFAHRRHWERKNMCVTSE